MADLVDPASAFGSADNLVTPPFSLPARPNVHKFIQGPTPNYDETRADLTTCSTYSAGGPHNREPGCSDFNLGVPPPAVHGGPQWNSSLSSYDNKANLRTTVPLHCSYTSPAGVSHIDDDDNLLVTPYPIRDHEQPAEHGPQPHSSTIESSSTDTNAVPLPAAVEAPAQCNDTCALPVIVTEPISQNPKIQLPCQDVTIAGRRVVGKRRIGWRLRRPTSYRVLRALRHTQYVPRVPHRKPNRTISYSAVSQNIGDGPHAQHTTSSADYSMNSVAFDPTKGHCQAEALPLRIADQEFEAKGLASRDTNMGTTMSVSKDETCQKTDTSGVKPFTSSVLPVAEPEQFLKTEPAADSENFKSSSPDASFDLSVQWTQLNRKLREHGISTYGVPVLDRDVARVFGPVDICTTNDESHHHHHHMGTDNCVVCPLSGRVSATQLPEAEGSAVSNTSFPAIDTQLGKQRVQRRRPPKTMYSSRPGNQHGITENKDLSRYHNVASKPAGGVTDATNSKEMSQSDDAVTMLLANIDVVKMIELWNKTLDELYKYRHYCSDLCQFEGSHVRIFQQNDTLKKEASLLKAKVASLERLLQQHRASETEHWESQVDYHQLEIENARLLKTLKEERQKMKVVIVQKRRSDMTINNLKQQMTRLLQREDRIRTKAKETLEKVARGSTSSSLTHVASDDHALKCDFKYAFSDAQRLADGQHKMSFRQDGAQLRKRHPLGKTTSSLVSATTNSVRQLLKTNGGACASQGVVELIWFYEEQVRGVKRVSTL